MTPTRNPSPTMTDIAPPAAATWDVEDIVTQALAVLRLGPGDVDEGRVETMAVVACGQVDSLVDSPESIDPTPAMIDSAVQTTIALYRRKDAPFGTADAWSSDAVAVGIPTGPLAGGRAEVLPDKRRWGVG
jgi:hypothetical protein